MPEQTKDPKTRGKPEGSSPQVDEERQARNVPPPKESDADRKATSRPGRQEDSHD